ncbi:MAG: M48 family metallopeptidase [Flavobacteriales bacterium]|nr:M48 family metallopeptidase [Flavobacteriales bacterium]
MNPTTIFHIIIIIIVLNFILERWLSWLNDKNSSDNLPDELKGIYDQEKYAKQRAYDKVKDRFSIISSTFSFILILLMLFFKGFAFIDELAKTFTENVILLPLVFFAILMVASDILNVPFSLYSTFVIEEKFGFNRTTVKTYILDKIKGALIGTVLGGGLMALFIWFYNYTGDLFWLWTWGAFAVFMILITMFYASVIVPLFNKLTPLEDGELKEEITSYCKKVGFKLDNLFVMDGSKRSSKANAFFSGLGSKKRIVLYDTLANEYSKEEITAVLAHEIGHYKKKHTLTTIIVSILQIGLMLFVLSLVINMPEFSLALGVKEKSFHISLLVFSLLYSPLSMLIGVTMNVISRKNEYEADNYAKTTYNAEPLVSSLKKLSVDSLSNLTPHPYYVFVNYSHPTLLQRIKALYE